MLSQRGLLVLVCATSLLPLTACTSARSAAPAAMSAHEVAADLDAIRNFEQGWDAAAMRGDDSYTLARVAPDYTGVSPDGHVMDRAGLLADLARGRQDLRVYQPDRPPQIHLYGDTAVVHGHDVLVTNDGRTFYNIFTDTWLRRDGQWQIISSMDAGQP